MSELSYTCQPRTACIEVDDVQRAKRAAVGERVGHEVHRPPFPRRLGTRHRQALAAREPLAAPAAHLQTGLAIHATHPFVIGVESFAGDEHVQPAIPIPRACRSVRLESGEQFGVVDTTPPLIPPGRCTQAHRATGAAQTGVLRVDEPPHRHALGDGAYHFFPTTAFNA